MIDLLQEFSRRHHGGDRLAGDDFLASLRGLWPDIPVVELDAEAEPVDALTEADEVFLEIVGDVGDAARIVLSDGHTSRRLAWCRENLIGDAERFIRARDR